MGECVKAIRKCENRIILKNNIKLFLTFTRIDAFFTNFLTQVLCVLNITNAY